MRASRPRTTDRARTALRLGWARRQVPGAALTREAAMRAVPTLLIPLLLAADASAGERVPAAGLTLELPALEGLKPVEVRNAQIAARWTGRLGASDLSIDVVVLDAAEFGFREPEDVLSTFEGHHVGQYEERGMRVVLGARDVVAGAFGYVPYASTVTADASTAQGDAGRLWIECGLSPTRGWAVLVEAFPVPDAAGVEAIEAFLTEGVVGEGEPRNWRWTDEEALARWVEFAPEGEEDDMKPPLRTQHYIILTNSSGGKKFAEKMEQCYATIQKTFPFPEAEGRRLMPVFLFTTPQQYHEYYAKIAGTTIEQAARSAGHAWRDYYATSYAAPGDPVHIHEATHQIFANRLVLGGGGSWFQEGVAEYIETRANDRNNAARLVKKERHTPLREFVVIPSLLQSAEVDIKGGDEAGDHYKQAALLIEFLRESKFAKKGFPDFVNAVGRVSRGDLAAIEGAVRRVYGCSLEELEAEWVAYCKKR